MGKSHTSFEEKMKANMSQEMRKIINDAKFEMERRTPEEATEITAIINALMEDLNNFFKEENIRRIKKDAIEHQKNIEKELGE